MSSSGEGNYRLLSTYFVPGAVLCIHIPYNGLIRLMLQLSFFFLNLALIPPDDGNIVQNC